MMLRQSQTGAHDIAKGSGFVQHVDEKANWKIRYNLPIPWTGTCRGLSLHLNYFTIS